MSYREPGDGHSRRVTALVVFAAATAVLLAHAFYYYPFLADDALISLRYAERFLDGKGLTWTDGPRVEGYSNFAWVLLVAALGAIGIDLIVAARILGAVSSIGVVAAIVCAAYRFTSRPVLAAVAGCLVWVASAAAAAWTFAGLETPLVACLVAWSIVCALALDRRSTAGSRAGLALGGVLGVLALTRPDGILFTATIAGWVLVRRRARPQVGQLLAGVVVIPILLLAAQLVFRLAYYGDWLPNTAHVKLNPSARTWMNGLRHLERVFSSLRPVGDLGFVAIVALCLRPAWRTWGSLLAAIAGPWLAYVACVGGDSFPAARQMSPFIVATAFAAVACAAWLREMRFARPQRTAAARLGVVTAAAVVWGSFVFTQFRHEFNVRAKEERWEWTGKRVGNVLARGFAAQQPLVAVSAAGSVPYWSKLPCLDMLGLNDRHIARTPVAHPGERRIGHEKADVEYVLGRKPDLILYGIPSGGDPKERYARLLTHPDFLADYVRCAFAAPIGDSYIVSRMWANRRSPRIGIRSTVNRVEVPCYLLGISSATPAHLDRRQRFYAVATSEALLGIGDLRLDAGRWHLTAPAGDSLDVSVIRSSDRQVLPVEAGVVPTFEVPRAGAHHIVLRARDHAVHVYELVLQKD